MKNGNESRDVFGDSQKRSVARRQRKENTDRVNRLQDSLLCPMKKKNPICYPQVR